MASSPRQETEAHSAAGEAYSPEESMPSFKARRSGDHTWHNTLHSRKRTKNGVTIIEVIIVMVILSLLVGVAIISIGGVIGRGQQTAYEADDESIRTAVAAYYVAYTDWPTFDGEPGIIDMNKLVNPPNGQPPYLDSIPNSASALNCGGCIGHYTWSVAPDGRVTSACTGCSDGSGDGYRGVYP